MCSGDTHETNIAAVAELAAQAAGQGAELLCLPEVAGLMNRNGEVARTQVVEAGSDPFIAACRDLAAQHAMWIHIGSTPVLAPDGRFLNHSAVIDATGTIRATYDKVHLFDVAIEGQAPIGESKRFAPGEWRSCSTRHGGHGGCRSATTCASLISTAATDRKA